MGRSCLWLVLPLVVCVSAAAGVPGEEDAALRQALALEEALQQVIKQAEPAVACILVSRSDVYSSLFKDSPRPDQPGKLGGFKVPDPGLVRPWEPPGGFRPPFRRPRDYHRPEDDTGKKYDLANPAYVPESYGSGVVIDGVNRLVLTNYHVVREATKVYVRLPGGRGSYADIYAADPRSDLAVLQLIDSSVGPLATIKVGDGGSVRKGQFVVALSNPFAAGFRDGSPSASWGIISNVRRRAAGTPREEQEKTREQQLRLPVQLLLPFYPILLQTDARLDAGCSGGALVNLRGELIGLTNSRAAVGGGETAGGFALPLDANIRRILDRLQHGREVEYGFLGIVPPRDSSGEEEGVRVGYPIRGSPAAGRASERAPLQPGDLIVAINGTRVRTFEDLSLMVGTLLAGSEARLEVKKEDLRVVPVTLAKIYTHGKILVSTKPPDVRGLRVDYTSVLYTRDPTAFGSGGIPPGVYVREVLPGSPAERTAHLHENEIIEKVNGQEVQTPGEFYSEANKVPPSRPLKLTLWKRGDFHGLERQADHIDIEID